MKFTPVKEEKFSNKNIKGCDLMKAIINEFGLSGGFQKVPQFLDLEIIDKK